MSEEPTPGDVSDGDRWLVVGFVAVLLLALGALGWGYRSPNKPVPICASEEARCGDKTELAQ